MKYKFIVTASSSEEAMWKAAEKMQPLQKGKGWATHKNPVTSSGLNGSTVSYPKNIQVQDGTMDITDPDTGETTTVPKMMPGPTYSVTFYLPNESDPDFDAAADETLADE